MCCPVLQRYSLTETCGASFVAVPETQVKLLGAPKNQCCALHSTSRQLSNSPKCQHL